MRSESKRRKTFTRRALILGGGKLALISVLAARLYHLQSVESEKYLTLAEGNRVKLHLIPPARGRIVDRQGQPLATNKANYRVMFDMDQFAQMKQTLEQLTHVITLPEEKIKAALETAKRQRRQLSSLAVTEYLTWSEVARIELNLPELPGIFIELGQVRHYAYRDRLAHVLGYLSAPSEEQYKERPLYRIPDFKAGKDGLELFYEEKLRGEPGVKTMEVDAHGLAVRELAREEPKPGDEVKLTLDIRLHDLACDLLTQNKSASAAIMDIHTGEVYALASMPAYDPNTFAQRISADYWKILMEDPLTPLLNKTIKGIYPPGSTFKMMTGLAGLEDGAVGPETTFFCPGYHYLGSHRFGCWKKEGHGTVNLKKALAQSCDVYFYHVSQRIGIDKIAAVAKKFGLGSPTGIEVPGEKGGLMPTTEWKRLVRKERWNPGDNLNCAIGQGFVLATPLQLAVMAARLANGGKKVVPRIGLTPAGKGEAAGPPFWEDVGVSQENLRHILGGMNAVVNEPGGTAYGKRITQPHYAMAGKTGTSQVRRINHAIKRRDSDIPWEERHHALFVAYAPVHAPRFSCAVVVEHGHSGSAAAAPIARDLMLKVQELYLPNATPPQAQTQAASHSGSFAPPAHTPITSPEHSLPWLKRNN